jgi:spermidine synthase
MAGLGLLLRDKDTLRLKNAVAVCLAIALVGLAASGPVHEKTVAWQGRGKTIVRHRDSVYGHIVVTREKSQYTVFYDGLPLVSLPHPDLYFTTDFIHLALLNRHAPKNILFIGTAAGGLIAETIKYPVKKIVYADTDPALIDILKNIDDPLTKKEFADPRLVIAADDGRRFLAFNRERFDVIFIPAGLPTSLVANRFQTLEFFLKVRSALTDDGIAVFKTAGSLASMSRELKDINAVILKTMAAAFPEVRVLPGDGYNIFLASNKKIPLDPAILSANIRTLKEPAPLLGLEYLKIRLDKGYSDWFLANIKEELATTTVNQDIRPSALYDGLGFYYAQFSKKIPALFGGLRNGRGRWILWVVLILFFVARRWTHRRSQRPALLSWLAASTGFSGMTSQILCLLLFQSIVGRLFYWLALLSAAFMAGAALGAATFHQHQKKLASWKQLARIEALLGLLVMGWIIGIAVSYEKTGASSSWLFWINSFVAGYSVGLQLPVIFGLGLLPGLRDEQAARWAGRINGLDLWGACGAALLVPLFLLPSYGLITTAACVILLRLANTWNILRSADLD